MNITEERFSKNESRSVEIIQTETKYTHKKRVKKYNRASKTCGTISV